MAERLTELPQLGGQPVV